MSELASELASAVNPVAAGPVADVVSAFLMLFGALSCLLGAIGLVRLPDLPARVQAATKPQTLGLSLILVGTALRGSWPVR